MDLSGPVVAENVVGSIVGTAIVIALGATAQVIRNLIAEFRFRISGTYSTRTTGTAWLGTGHASGQPVRRGLRLRQSGRRVRGFESSADENAEWLIEGDLTPDGFVIGRYRPTRPPTSVSRGTFYLEQDRRNNRRFAGMWTGWHATDRSIVSGDYVWELQTRAPWWKSLLPWLY